MGRHREPAATKRLKGNPGRRKIVDEASAPLTDDVLSAAPEWRKAEARDRWGKLAPELARLHLLSRPDVHTFARYCELFGLGLTAQRALAGGDLVVTTQSEHVTMDRLNKNLQAMLLLETRLVDLEDRFGLNPANRQRIYALRAGAGAAGAAGPAPGLFDNAAPSIPQAPAPPASPIGMLSRRTLQ